MGVAFGVIGLLQLSMCGGIPATSGVETIGEVEVTYFDRHGSVQSISRQEEQR